MIRYAQWTNNMVGATWVDHRGLQKWIPDVSNPWNLPDEQLEARGYVRCEITQPTIGPYQMRGDRIISDDAMRPIPITWAVLDRPLAEIKTEVAEKIDAARDDRFEEGFTFAGHRYQTRQQDRENIAGAVQLATLALMNGASPTDTFWHGGEQPFVWIREDNELTVMDAATMIAFGQAAAAHKHALIFQARGMKNAMAAATDVAGVLTAMEWV